MKTKKIIKTGIGLVIFGAILIQWFEAGTYGSGPPAGHSNAPDEDNCTACHSGSLNTAGSNLTFSNGKSTLEYIPDSTYTITISFALSGIGRFGFQTTALVASSETFAGTFTVTNSSRTQRVSANINGSTRYYMEHTSGGTSGTNSNSWSFSWKAPSDNVGNIDFYIVVNAANGDNSSSGDAIYAKMVTLTPSTKLPVATITPGVTSVCQNDSITFNGSATNTPTGYEWTFTNASPSTATTQNVKVKATGGNITAKLVATNAFGPSMEESKTVTVNAAPAKTVTAGGSLIFCDGGSVKLTASNGSSYAWSTGETTRDITVTKTGAYYVTVTNSNNCSMLSDTVKVTVNPRSKISITQTQGQSVMCEGDTAIFQASSGYNTYIYMIDGFPVANSASPELKGPALAGTHTVSVVGQDNNNCFSDTASLTVTVVPKLTMGQPQCDTSTTEAVTIQWAAVQGALGYEVSVDTGKTWMAPSSGATGLSHTESGLPFSQAIDIHVRALDNSPCNYSDPMVATCKTKACSGLTYDLDYDKDICTGNSVDVSFSNFSAQGYAISVDGTNFTKDVSYTWNPAADTTITLHIIDSAMLNCPAELLNLAVKVHPQPVVSLVPATPVFCDGDPVGYTAQPAGLGTYSFYINNTLQQSDTSASFTAPGLGHGDTVRVELAADFAKGCSAQDEEVVVVEERSQPGFTWSANALIVTFSDTTSDIASRVWHFGDGDTSSLQDPVHVYAAEGTFEVKLITINNAGCKDSAIDSITLQSTAMAQNFASSDIKVVPNPFSDKLQITYHAKSNGAASITIFNDKGQVVIPSYRVEVNAGLNKINVPVVQLAQGVFFLHFSSGSYRHVERLLKWPVR